MTLDMLRRRMRAIHARLGFEGRLALTIDQDGDCYVTHWVKPDSSAFEDCRAVGRGSAEVCLQALEDYVDRYARRPTVEEIGRTLGILPAEQVRYGVAAE